MPALEALFFQRRAKLSRGIDRVSADSFQKNLKSEVQKISDRLFAGTYKFSPYMEMLVLKGRDKAPRVIARATVRDKLLLAALKNVLHEALPHEVPRKLPNQVVRELLVSLEAHEGVEILRADISSFYDSISHAKVEKMLASRLGCADTVALTVEALRAPVVPVNYRRVDREKYKNGRGVPQGLPTSNFLANLFLTRFDLGMQGKLLAYHRYVDDILIVCRKGESKGVKSMLVKSLAGLGLKVNKEKTRVFQFEERSRRDPRHAEALPDRQPARSRLLADLRHENPDLADRLQNEDFATTAIYLDSGRGLRSGNALRQDQRNNTVQDIDQNHAATLDSRRMRGNVEIASNDLLIGEGGNDTLRAHRGDDILIGGQGRDRMEGGEGRDTYVVDAGDTMWDSDGVGEVRWGGQALTGGARAESDPAGTYRSEDGRFAYALQGDALTVTDTLAQDQARREPMVIEHFRSGQLGITLTGPEGRGAHELAGRQHPDDPNASQASLEDRRPGNVTPPGPVAAPEIARDRDHRHQALGRFDDAYVDRAYAALLAGDSKELDRVAVEFSRSLEGQRMAEMGDQLLAQQQSLERQLSQEPQAQTSQDSAVRM